MKEVKKVTVAVLSGLVIASLGFLSFAASKGCSASFEGSLTGSFKAQVEQCRLEVANEQN